MSASMVLLVACFTIGWLFLGFALGFVAGTAEVKSIRRDLDQIRAWRAER